MKEIILNCPSPRTKALLAFQYVLACRVGELVRYKHSASQYLNNNKIVVAVPEYVTSGLLKQNMREYPDYWEVLVPNFKQGSGKVQYKTGIIMKDTKENWLRDTCFNWLNMIQGEQVFVFQEETARNLARKALVQLGIDAIANKGFSSHNLRDSRADHLLKIFHFNIIDVQKTLGHKNLNSTQQYIDSSIDERAQKLKQASTT